MGWTMRKFNFFIILFIILIYYFFTGLVNEKLFVSSAFPYYNYLLDAFFNFRFDLHGVGTHDLSFYQNKWYMYWGPGPVLFILPFYLLSGLKACDIFYTLVAGLANVIIFYYILDEFCRYFEMEDIDTEKAVVLMSFALASPNFYLSLSGRIWHTGQIIATTYLLLFIFFLFKFLNRKMIIYLISSLFFFNLSWFSRYSLILYFFLIIYIVVMSIEEKNKKPLIRMLICIISISLIFASISAYYNYARFGNMLEKGFRYQVGDERFYKYYQQGKMFSLSHMSHNIDCYFFNHASISTARPYIKMDMEGNSVFSVYPLLLFFPFLFQRKYFQKKKEMLFLITVFLTAGTSMFLLLINLGSGWVQFGSRYFLDIIPLTFLLILFPAREIPRYILYIILIYGIVINVLGGFNFYMSV